MYQCKTCGHTTNEPVIEVWGGEEEYYCPHCGDKVCPVDEDCGRVKE
jgi:DNA-directed RNA polymerase subunit RPC12/RpoP